MTEELNVMSVYEMPEYNVLMIKLIFREKLEIGEGDILVVRHDFNSPDLPNVKATIERLNKDGKEGKDIS